jgi:hypothetical protein
MSESEAAGYAAEVLADHRMASPGDPAQPT